MTTPLCPRCKVPMRLRLTSRSVHLGGPLKRVWACTEVGCDIVCGAHPDGTPMGVPGDHDTRRARQRAHAEFDAKLVGIIGKGDLLFDQPSGPSFRVMARLVEPVKPVAQG